MTEQGAEADERDEESIAVERGVEAAEAPRRAEISEAAASSRDDVIIQIDTWPATRAGILQGLTWQEWRNLPFAERAARCKSRSFLLLTMDDEATDWIESQKWKDGDPPMSPDEHRAVERAELMRELERAKSGAKPPSPQKLKALYAKEWTEALGLDLTKVYPWDELRAEDLRQTHGREAVEQAAKDEADRLDAERSRLECEVELRRLAQLVGLDPSKNWTLDELKEAKRKADIDAKSDSCAATISAPSRLLPPMSQTSGNYHTFTVTKAEMAALGAIQEMTKERYEALDFGDMKSAKMSGVPARADKFAEVARAAVRDALSGQRLVTPVDWLGSKGGEGPESIWSTRPELEHIMNAARTMKLSPWALLGQALTCAAAMIPYYVPFRSFLGSRAVNLLVAVAGSTGTGKTAAESAVRDIFAWPVDLGQALEAGSGEAIPSAYAYVAQKADKELNIKKGDLVWRHEDRLGRFGFDEVGRLNAVQGRQGATVLEYLKSAESGAALGRVLASGEGVQLPAKEYRFTATMNVQPERAHLITSADEAAGSLPGRMLWVSAEYAPFVHMPRRRERSTPYPLSHLNWTTVQAIEALEVMEEVFEQQQDAALAGELDPMESHAALLRAKVACCLMVLAGRQALIETDWDLAGLIIGNSRTVRGEVLRGLADDTQDLKIQERVRITRVIEAMRRHKAAGTTMGAARKKLPGRDRCLWDDAVIRGDGAAW